MSGWCPPPCVKLWVRGKISINKKHWWSVTLLNLSCRYLYMLLYSFVYYVRYLNHNLAVVGGTNTPSIKWALNTYLLTQCRSERVALYLHFQYLKISKDQSRTLTSTHFYVWNDPLIYFTKCWGGALLVQFWLHIMQYKSFFNICEIKAFLSYLT